MVRGNGPYDHRGPYPGKNPLWQQRKDISPTTKQDDGRTPNSTLSVPSGGRAVLVGYGTTGVQVEFMGREGRTQCHPPAERGPYGRLKDGV